MSNNIFTLLLLITSVIYSVVAVRPGEPCNSQFGEGLCSSITQCKLLPRIKMLGRIPTMCGYDSNGPIVCCPKYSRNLHVPKSDFQRETEKPRPDLDFIYEMQGDEPVNNHRQSDYYNTNFGENKQKYNKYNYEYNDFSNFAPTSTSSWLNNVRRKSTHDRFHDRPDTSTSRYSSFNEPNFRPERRPTFESNSYESNDFRPDTSRPNSFTSNNENSWNSNNKPFSTSNEWSENRPSNTHSSSRPTSSYNNLRPSNFGSSSNYGTTESDEDQPVWGSVNQRSTTRRPESSTSYQTGWSRPKRISQIKCEEYSETVTNNLRPLPLLPNPEIVSVPVEKCSLGAVALIVGGTDTSVGEFPHMAAIGFQSRGNVNWNCGGTLISDEYILTAAHCTHSSEGQPVRVRLGDWNLKRDDDTQSVDYRVSKIIVHPQYSKTKKYNDIALLQLDRRVQFKETIRPACLFDQDNIPVNKTVATGWGRVETAGAKSGILQKVELSLFSNRNCNEVYRDMSNEASLNNGISDNMLCAGDMGGGHDTCFGDSGGPLQFTNRENRCVYHIIGVTSFGKATCGQYGSPGVYTRVSSFLPWIETVVWGEKS